MPRAATAECQDCHYVFPKPEMVEWTDLAPKYKQGRSYRRRDTNGLMMIGREKGSLSVTSKTVWLCRNCEAQRRQSRYVWILVLTAIFAIAVLWILLTGLREPLFSKSPSNLPLHPDLRIDEAARQ